MLHLVNYANRPFRRMQADNTASALSVGGIDRVHAWGPSNIDWSFYRRNRAILGGFRGAGYWLWKPYVIRRTLARVNAGDWIFYCDSAAIFIANPGPLLDRATESAADVMMYELPYLERHYTKRDTLVLMDCDTPAVRDTPQRLASFLLLRKGAYAVDFVDRWLGLAQDPRLLTDATGACGLPEYPDFIAHRHDQSILSLLSKGAGLPVFRDPSQFGNASRAGFPNDRYGQLIDHHRQGPRRGRLNRLEHRCRSQVWWLSAARG